jgi:hypothetical protein
MDRVIHTSCHYEDQRMIYEGELHDRWLSPNGEDANELHWWTLRLVVEADSGIVLEAQATPKRLPFPECPLVGGTVSGLEGLSLKRGFTKHLRETLGSVEGCTHLYTLAMSIWSTQVIARYLDMREDIEGHVPPSVEHALQMSDACRGWRADSGVVRAGLERGTRPGPWREGMPITAPRSEG